MSKDKNKIEVIINGKTFPYFQERDVIRDLVSRQTEHFRFQSLETMKENMRRLMEMFQEFLSLSIARVPEKEQKEKKKILFQLQRKVNGFLRYSLSPKTTDKMMDQTYNFLLSLDGMNLLPGFGFGNKLNHKLIGNSERVSILNLKTLLKEE